MVCCKERLKYKDDLFLRSLSCSKINLISLFYIGVFLIPFDNFVFAPTGGWAAIAPILFLPFIFANLNLVKINSKTVYLLLFLSLLSFFNYLFYGFNLSNLIDCFATLILGVSFYFSLKIVFTSTENCYKFIKVLSITYLVSFILGLLIYASSFTPLYSIVSLLMKRTYGTRLQYTFTEPSYISMHVYGVILLSLMIFRRFRLSKYYKLLKLVFALFIVFTLIFGDSSRFIIDSIAIAGIFVIYYLWKKSKLLLICLCLFGFLIFIIIYIFRNQLFSGRILNILNNGITGDPSLAARFFRINAIVVGSMKSPLNFFFGYGLGNTFIPFNNGFMDIYGLYSATSYLGEINDLYGTTLNTFNCLFARLLADFGLISTFVIFLVLFKKKNVLMYMIFLYLYLQFDSFAFYTIWILLYANQFKNGIWILKEQL